MFNPGQQVRVNHVFVSVVNGTVTGRVPAPEFIGTVVNYWRNDNYIVREPEFGTTMAYPASELAEV